MPLRSKFQSNVPVPNEIFFAAVSVPFVMNKNISDIDILNRYKNEFIDGNDTAFSQLYRLLSNDLYAYGLSFHAHHELIEDAIHDIFINIYSNKKVLIKVDNVKSYLFSAFRHRLFFLIKKESLQIYLEENDYPEQIEANMEDHWIEQEEEARKKAQVSKLLRGLNIHQREVVYLRYMEGLSCEEVSNIMKIDVQSVKNLTYRAMKKIKTILTCMLPLMNFIY
jgi:RNA polymerase sigma factor (sigma-70 family)